MMSNLSTLMPVSPDMGKAYWKQSRFERSEIDEEKRLITHHMIVPSIMPGTIIFVHGVNSEGEWYAKAEEQFCKGLNLRLGRSDLARSEYNPTTRRFYRARENNELFASPVIPFYWGYKLQPGDEQRYPGIYHRDDKAWGGGPFQNGTNNLLQFWQDGFRRHLLGGVVDLQALNPEISRQLQDAPPRGYYVHAAKRLANLIDTIRSDFPNEPINVIAHSQGTMITLCAMLYVQKRPPDTVILNSSPYSFDTKVTDYLSAANGDADVQTADARRNTFWSISKKLTEARTQYPEKDKYDHECGWEGVKGITTLHVHVDPGHPQANSHVGGLVDDQPWHEHEHSGRDNRGKLFVNFNPADRVIGVSAVAGIGWQGIPSKILNETSPMFANVYQRVFAGNTTVGDRSNYWFNFFNLTTLRQQVESRAGGVTTGYGAPLRTQGTYLQTFDGKPSRDFWMPASPSVAGVVPELATPTDSQRVWINAPVVPDPVRLGSDFQEMSIRFDGVGLQDNGAQAHDFSDFRQFYQPVDVTEKDVYGQAVTRKETPEEVAARMAKYGQQQIAQTNHGQILEYDGNVSHVLAYDITVGFGHAFGDPAYWNYLKDMADWKISDPYYKTGQLPDIGGYPNGLDTGTNKEQQTRWREMLDKKAPAAPSDDAASGFLRSR
ncbi:T6SS effector phospholipase Tle3 domain-containing protein [Paraburkholderia saeva]|uniref:T6SS effector phospholipase Tle3 domain-containing protein n=1 Tax=Paraburkholderia saeva TaxID=2777537 RepID=UPI001DF5AB08|nr:DUF3274 domain-containing protein [Paraburkholderia saeva]CAG4920532.1 hypothetical protein R70241_04864 [Paraburkholderia saeva]